MAIAARCLGDFLEILVGAVVLLTLRLLLASRASYGGRVQRGVRQCASGTGRRGVLGAQAVAVATLAAGEFSSAFLTRQSITLSEVSVCAALGS